jgi:altronate dehydratase small subunit
LANFFIIESGKTSRDGLIKLKGGKVMSHEIMEGSDSLVMNEKDDVATVLRDMPVGERMRYRKGESAETIVLLNPIAFGHKVAITSIKLGDDVYKYGDIIGRATQDIEPGEHVHVHNIEGVRGRGDLAQKNKGAQ